MNYTEPPTVANHIVKAVLSHVRNNKDPLIATPFSTDRRADSIVTKIANGDDSSFDASADEQRILHVGLDWGASKTCLKAAFAGSDELVIDECIPTVLGLAKDGIVDGVLPDNATSLFGREALTHRRHLHLTYPEIDSAAAPEFARHLRSRLEVPATAEIRAVIAVPATSDAEARENIRNSLSQHFQSVILLPQSYLFALGLRDESRLLDPDYTDPIRNSIFIDIGASATNLCLVQGYYPTADEQLALNFGGKDLDDLLRTAMLQTHPEAELSSITIRHLKEQHAFAGLPAKPIRAEVVLAGKSRTLDLTNEICVACNELLGRLLDGLKTLLAATPNDTACELLQNVILCGGGSRIKNIDAELERLLHAEAFANARVQCVGDRYKHLAAAGALKAARQARNHHWQQVTI